MIIKNKQLKGFPIWTTVVLCLFLSAMAVMGENCNKNADESGNVQKEKAKLKITRIYTGADSESHFEDVEIPLSETNPNFKISRHQKVTGIIFLETHGKFDFHTAPQKQYVVFLDGGVEIETGRGEKRIFNAGDILLAEDTTGRGHKIRALDNKPHRSIFITID